MTIIIKKSSIFTPGNTGFKVWDTRYAKIGIGICWDQWFPETARCLALNGAELLFYPTAIGSEPILDTDVVVIGNVPCKDMQQQILCQLLQPTLWFRRSLSL